MRARLNRRVAAAAVAGLVAGTVIAVADRGAADRQRPPFAAASAAVNVQRSPLPAPRGARIAVQQPSTAGGAPWAVRTFTSTQRGRTLRCAQLGRLDGGRFGWIAPGGSLRPARFASTDVPTVCDSPRFLVRIDLQILRVTLTTDPATGPLAPAQTVTWGHAAPGITRIRTAGTTITVAGGAFLHVEPGPGPRGPAPGELHFSDGDRKTFDRAPPDPPRPRDTPDTDLTVAVRAPDPAGGLPWAVLAARSARGETCLSSPDRVLGNRLGSLDARLGLFSGALMADTTRCPEPRRSPTRASPARLDTGLHSGPDVNAASGRTQLRRLDRRTVLSGRVHPDVVAVTLRTPRDVRTLVPSRIGHAILAVYDGAFPAGEITATSRFRDGRRVTQNVTTGGA